MVAGGNPFYLKLWVNRPQKRKTAVYFV